MKDGRMKEKHWMLKHNKAVQNSLKFIAAVEFISMENTNSTRKILIHQGESCFIVSMNNLCQSSDRAGNLSFSTRRTKRFRQ